MGCHAHAPLMRHALAEHEHAAFVKICVFRGKTKRTSPRMGPTLVARGETPRNQIENTHSPRMGPAYQRVLTSLHSTPIYVGPSGASVFVWANRSQGSRPELPTRTPPEPSVATSLRILLCGFSRCHVHDPLMSVPHS